jgi:Bacterial Ig domain
MSCIPSTRLFAVVAAMLAMLGCMQGAAAQAASPAGLGDQLFATGGDITVEVLAGGIAGFTSELRLYNADGTFTKLATNRETGRVVTLPSRPVGEELVFGIYVVDTRYTYKTGPGDRNPDGIEHAAVTKTGERQFDVGFEDLYDGGDRDYDDNVFRFTGGLAPNRAPVADDQALKVAQSGSLPITLTATDPEGDKLTYSISDQPLHGTLSGSGTALTYVPAAGFSGLDTFAFSAADAGASDEGRVTIEVTPVKTTPTTPTPTTGSGRVDLGDCPFGEVTLVNVRRIGSRVLLTGLAQPTLAGAPVEIVEGGVVITRTTIRRDGVFSTRVRVPSARGGRVLRYQARLGVLRSRNLRLRRRMVTTSAKLRGGKIVFSGRVAGVGRLRTRPVAVLFARPRGCDKDKTYVRIGSARIGRNGRFTVRAKPLPGVGVAVYRVRAKLPRRIVSFTLPRTIAGR